MVCLVPIRIAGPVLRLAGAIGVLAVGLFGQIAPSSQARLDWRRVGTLTLAEGRPSPSAAGPVERVAFLADGSLVAGLAGGRFWRTADGETWTAVDSAPLTE